jgi:EAL domain-containing protein (putative c-di-GMP-specific phosphodiesterase class I)
MAELVQSLPARPVGGLTAEQWYLEAVGETDPARCRIPIREFPFVIGRRADMALCLASPAISKTHAEIYLEGGQILLRDLGSTNGTFVNGQRIHVPTPLIVGASVHFGPLQYILGKDTGKTNEATVQEIPREWIGAVCLFDKLFDDGIAIPYFQPIVAAADQTVAGYEVLARSSIEGLSMPRDMFSLAETLHQETELSKMYRTLGVHKGQAFPVEYSLLLNTHPAETRDPTLVESMALLREEFPSRPFVVEIHESAVTDKAMMTSLREQLRDLDIRLAYDDFGTGRDRLLDLVEIPPDILKFDARFIRGIDSAETCKRQVVESLVKMVRELGIAPLAEGIETAGEHEVCRDLGFHCAQGFYYGRPLPIENYLTSQ